MGGVEVESLPVEVQPPKLPRQFQVVPVPAAFSRGRWRCSDYGVNDMQNREVILQFERNGKSDRSFVNPWFKSNSSSQQPEVVRPTVFIGPIDLRKPVIVAPLPELDETPPKSTTFLVTSIQPGPSILTPVMPDDYRENVDHGARNIPLVPKPAVKALFTEQKPQVAVKVATPATPGHAPSRFEVVPVKHDTTTVMSQSKSDAGPVAARVEPVRTTSVVAQQGHRSNTPPSNEEDGSAATVPAGPPVASNFNAAAIDNKIEQAMDLVKTHLTYAVREQVDVLRQTIVDLEQKVTVLQKENNTLRQYIPQDVLIKLSALLEPQAPNAGR